ncbi:hypothetical protein E4198_00070 [Streptomyces sp. RKND-216]|uniref:hypothetical protein n=1 Tax=Streptomyces sp. RKND-216 TaxID=2562581 RepID=UPI00109DD02D|nr:hypothetical protein [Streptomyces sp. RKND-216]THA28246.1 hypothetical protein E4198_00070 [Streptomyces sp. RKND-216]
MNAIIATPVQPRESATDLLAAAYERHAAALTRWFAKRVDWHRAEDLASEVWTELAGSLEVLDRRVLKLDWLLLVAGNVFRRDTGDDTDPAVLTDPADLDQLDIALAATGQAADVDQEQGEVSALDFRRSHGDPATWTSSDFDAYEHLAETGEAATVTRLPRTTADDVVLEVRAA